MYIFLIIYITELSTPFCCLQQTSMNDLEVEPGIEFSGMILKNRKKVT